jgi:hypothetical protein
MSQEQTGQINNLDMRFKGSEIPTIDLKEFFLSGTSHSQLIVTFFLTEEE